MSGDDGVSLQPGNMESLPSPDTEIVLVQRNPEVHEFDMTEWGSLSKKTRRFAVKAAILSSLGGLLFGYDMGVVEGALPLLGEDLSLSTAEKDYVVGFMLLGGIAGACIGGVLVDWIGRWRTIVVTALIFVVGGVTLFLATTVVVLYVGRFIVGIAIAISAIADVSYLTEVAPRCVRGAMVSTNDVAVALGVLLSFLVGAILKDKDEGWRWMFGFSVMLAFVQMVAMTVMPLSPRWLVVNKRMQDAEDALNRIYASPEEVSFELYIIEEEESTSTEDSHTELTQQWRPQLVIAIALATIQQLSANSNLLSFAAAIFNSSGIQGSAPVVVMGFVKLLATLLAVLQVDHIGRRRILLIGSGIIVISLVLLTGSYTDLLKNTTYGAWIAFISCCSLVASYAYSFGPMTFLVISELFPSRLRGRAGGIGQVANWCGNLLVSAYFLRLLNHAGPFFTFFMFGVASLWGFIFLFWFLPETNGKEPQHIASEVLANPPRCYCPNLSLNNNRRSGLLPVRVEETSDGSLEVYVQTHSVPSPIDTPESHLI